MKLLIPTFFKEHYPVAAMAMMAWAAYPAAATAAPSFDCGKASIAIVGKTGSESIYVIHCDLCDSLRR